MLTTVSQQTEAISQAFVNTVITLLVIMPVCKEVSLSTVCHLTDVYIEHALHNAHAVSIAKVLTYMVVHTCGKFHTTTSDLLIVSMLFNKSMF